METLSPSFSKKGFLFNLVKRIGRIAIFKKTRLTTNKDDSYEVIIVQKHDGYFMAGTFIKAGECFPGNNDWGSKGWTYRIEDYDRAELKFNELLIKEQNRKHGNP